MTRFKDSRLEAFAPDRQEDVPPRRELPRETTDALGYPSREPLERKKRLPKKGPSDQINIRADIADINAFIGWCEANRYTFREGFRELVRAIASK